MGRGDASEVGMGELRELTAARWRRPASEVESKLLPAPPLPIRRPPASIRNPQADQPAGRPADRFERAASSSLTGRSPALMGRRIGATRRLGADCSLGRPADSAAGLLARQLSAPQAGRAGRPRA